MEKSKQMNLQVMIEAAFLAAFALVLDLLPSITLAPYVSISFSMVPIFIVSIRWGWKAGVFSGFMWGLLQVVTGDAAILTWVQFLIEYFIAFACIGFAGFLAPMVQSSLKAGQKKKAMVWMLAAVWVGSLARYVWHFIAGVTFWGSYAPAGMSPVWYSFIFNGGAMLGSGLFCSIVLVVLTRTSARLIAHRHSISHS